MSIIDSLYKSDDPNETTFKYDSLVPPLPVPKLEETIEKLLISIKPLAANDEQFEKVKEKANRFLRHPHVLKTQQDLIQVAQQKPNWLEDWWLEYAYLRSRKPLIPYSNMSAPMPIADHWKPVSPSNLIKIETCRIKRASLSTYFQLCFWKLLLNEKMRPMIHKGSPWTMNQFKNLFNTVRIPGKDVDLIKSTFESSSTGPLKKVPDSHIIVMHKGYIFVIECAIVPPDNDPSKVCIRPAPQIEKQLEYIQNWCKNKPFGPGVGALTTGERSEWAETRDYLRSFGNKNQRICDKIESALSVLVLDDNIPNTTDEIYRLSLCGDPANRWSDKSIISFAFRNGTFGASAEHTTFDGFCSGIMTNYLIMSGRDCKGQWHDGLEDKLWCNQSVAVQSNVPMPELLEFDLDSKLHELIGESKVKFVELCQSIQSMHTTFTHFGKELIKEHKMHPEAFFQCAIHSAYYKIHKSIASAYVTATTRRFYNGRTETCRSCYPEMLDFIKEMSHSTLDKVKDRSIVKKRYELLKNSVAKFTQLMDEACLGKGCDRHLLVLYLMAMSSGNGSEQIELFEDELFQRSNYFILSTSCSGYWDVCGGVPPIVDNGYGCFYGIEDRQMTICYTAYKNSETNLDAFRKALEESLCDMQKLLLLQREFKL